MGDARLHAVLPIASTTDSGGVDVCATRKALIVSHLAGRVPGSEVVTEG